jgi:hypothetical protein
MLYIGLVVMGGARGIKRTAEELAKLFSLDAGGEQKWQKCGDRTRLYANTRKRLSPTRVLHHIYIKVGSRSLN